MCRVLSWVSLGMIGRLHTHSIKTFRANTTTYFSVLTSNTTRHIFREVSSNNNFQDNTWMSSFRSHTATAPLNTTRLFHEQLVFLARTRKIFSESFNFEIWNFTIHANYKLPMESLKNENSSDCTGGSFFSNCWFPKLTYFLNYARRWTGKISLALNEGVFRKTIIFQSM